MFEARLLPGLQDVALGDLAARANRSLSALAASLPSSLYGPALGLLEKSPEGQSLADPGGLLRGELGVVFPGRALADVARAVAAALSSRVDPVRRVGAGRLAGGMDVSFLRADFAECLGTPLASFQSERGYRVDWLEWLLTAGDRVVVLSHAFVAGPSPRSRTGLGLMAQGAGVWRVPPQFAGTASDNFLTRSLAGLVPAVERLARAEFAKNGLI